jgi:tetratricopeptide (TPR) repeat protein
MNQSIKIVFYSITFLLAIQCFGQRKKADSLAAILKSQKADTNKVHTLGHFSDLLRNTNPDTALILTKQEYQLAKQLNFARGLARCNTQFGLLYENLGDLSLAITYYKRSLSIWDSLYPNTVLTNKIISLNNIANALYSLGDYKKGLQMFFEVIEQSEKMNDKAKIAGAYCNIGNIYKDQADYPTSLNYYFKGLKIAEELNHKFLITAILGNIGIIYYSQQNYDLALDYYSRSLTIKKELGDKIEITKTLNNIGIVCAEKHDYPKALEYYNKAYQLAVETGNMAEIAIIRENMGSVFFEQTQYLKAMGYFTEALKFSEEMGDKVGVAINTGNIGKTYLALKNYAQAEKYLKLSIVLCDSLNALSYLKGFEKAYSELAAEKGDHKSAYEHYKRFIAARDQISNQENIQKQTRLEMQFDFDKKQAADSVKVVEEKKVAAAELKAQKNKSYSLYGGLALVVLFAGFMFNRFRTTQRQKKIIEEQKVLVEQQKQMVEEKNKQVMDSIYYARRIQRSLLPTEKYMSKILKK